jgi:hypothetical protein
VVDLENFHALKTNRTNHTLKLVAGKEAEAANLSGKIEVQRIDLTQKSYFRGEQIRKMLGRVLATRDDLLSEQIAALQPDFDAYEERLPNGAINPLYGYRRILERRVSGTLSTIHGDLHTGNILIGPGGDAWLIDFEWTRDGHTLFDWAVLETSLLIDHVVASVPNDWKALRALADTLRDNPTQISPIGALRMLVSDLLAPPGTWAEYFTALSLCALRVIGWGNRPLAARRLAFLVSANAMQAILKDDRSPRSATNIADLTTDQQDPNVF